MSSQAPAAVYRGRFAPSPSGPLHFGSLIAAVGSYLDALSHDGQWLVRMEDLDPPREQAGAAADILRTLEAYGFEWHGAVVYQSQRHALYAQALAQLHQQGLLYYCDCTRKGIIARCAQGQYGAIYDGHCAARALPAAPGRAIRIRVAGEVGFVDRLQGSIYQNLCSEIGDFHLLRKDGLYAYHLGVVVDDAAQGITDIVRGFDLLDSTPRQIYLQQQLGYPTPRYAHLPLALKPDGDKLSKQTHASALNTENPAPVLWQALAFLQLNPPAALQAASLPTLWQWGREHWALEKLPARSGQVVHNTAFCD